MYANTPPPILTPLPISFSSIELTVLVMHGGVHQHDNGQKDGKGRPENLGEVYGEVGKNGLVFPWSLTLQCREDSHGSTSVQSTEERDKCHLPLNVTVENILILS